MLLLATLLRVPRSLVEPTGFNMAEMNKSVAQWFVRENLEGLHGEEKKIRDTFLAVVDGSEDLRDHLGSIHECMNFLESLRKYAPASPTQRDMALYGLSSRLFNDAACVLKLGLSGYHNGALSFIRDIVEVSFLLDYLTTDKTALDRWVTDTGSSEFWAKNIRKVLDTRDGQPGSKRGSIYGMFSGYGTHAAFKSSKLIMSPSGLQLGPFLNMKAQVAILEDTAKHLPFAVSTLTSNLAVEGHFQDKKIYARFYVTAHRWWERYMKSKLISDPVYLARLEQQAL